MPTASMHVDLREVVALTNSLNAVANRYIKNELSTAMLESTRDAEDAMNARVHHRSGNYKRSFKRKVQVSARTIVGIVSNAAKSKGGFVYAFTLEYGRGPVRAIRAKALRFEINGRVIFRKSVGPAPAQHIMEYGLRDAEPEIWWRFMKAAERIAKRAEARS